MLPPPPALIQPSSSRSSKGPRSGQEQMSRAAGPHVRTYPPRRRHRSPGAVSSTPTADPFVHPGASTTAYVASARSPPRAVAPSHPDGAPSPRRLSFCPDARRPSAANFRWFSLSSSSPGRITSRCMYVHDGGARWRAAPSGCPAGGGYPLPVLADTCYGRCSSDRYKKKKKTKNHLRTKSKTDASDECRVSIIWYHYEFVFQLGTELDEP